MSAALGRSLPHNASRPWLATHDPSPRGSLTRARRRASIPPPWTGGSAVQTHLPADSAMNRCRHGLGRDATEANPSGMAIDRPLLAFLARLEGIPAVADSSTKRHAARWSAYHPSGSPVLPRLPQPFLRGLELGTTPAPEAVTRHRPARAGFTLGSSAVGPIPPPVSA